MSNNERILLVDADIFRHKNEINAPHFPNATARHNSRLISFLMQAQEDFKVIILSEAGIEETRQRLALENIPLLQPVDYSSLLNNIESWENAKYSVVPVLLYELNENKERAPYITSWTPLEIETWSAPNAYQTWFKDVQDTEALQRKLDNDSESEINNYLERNGINPNSIPDIDDLFQKEALKSKMPNILTDVFNRSEIVDFLKYFPVSTANIRTLRDDTAEPPTKNIVEINIKDYVGYASGATNCSSSIERKKTLLYLRDSFKADVGYYTAEQKRLNISTKPPRDIVDPAIRAIHEVIKKYTPRIK